MRLLLWIAPVVVACSGEDEVTYLQFNSNNDRISVEVGVEDLLPPVSEDITSSTGEVVIGTVTVNPGGGPVGTNHDLVVVIEDDWEAQVDRVSVLPYPLDVEDAGSFEYDLEQDSADEGYYKTTLESVGDEGEVRTDTFLIRVWQVESDGTDGTDSSDGTGGS